MAQQNTGASQLAQLTRPGALNGGTDPRALYLKLFSGEMFKGFQHNAIARDLVMKRTLKNGKSLQFVYTGHTKASSIHPVTASWVTPTEHLQLLRKQLHAMTY